MALRALLHPHRPLCPMRFYPPSPVSFLHFVHNFSLSFSLFLPFVYSFAPLLSSLYFSTLARRLASKNIREGRRERGKKLESNRFLNGHRNYFLPDSTKEKKKRKRIWKKCCYGTHKRCVFECGLRNEMRARCVTVSRSRYYFLKNKSPVNHESDLDCIRKSNMRIYERHIFCKRNYKNI